MHHLILGPTGFGKSTVLWHLIREAQRAGRIALVLDQFAGTNWPGLGGPLLRVRSDAGEFLDLVTRSRNCLVAMDEAGDADVRREVDEINRKGRKWGHLCATAPHRPKLVGPTVRYMCQGGVLWCFRISPLIARTLEEEYGTLGFERAVGLPYYTCLRWDLRDVDQPPTLIRTTPMPDTPMADPSTS